MAPEEGFEPPTNWLTVNCSTTELLRNILFIDFIDYKCNYNLEATSGVEPD